MPYRQNKRTGEWWETDAQGNPIRPVQAAQTPSVTAAAIPMSPRQAAEEARKNDDSARAAQKAALDAAEAQRKAAEWVATHNPDGTPKLAPEAEIKRNQGVAEAQANLDNLNNLAGYVTNLRQQYSQNFAGKGVGALAEYAPAWARPENGVFNDTSGSLLADMARAKGLTSQQFNTPAEQRMFFQPLIPNSSDTDEQIVNKLNMLDRMVQTGRNNFANQIVAQGGQPKGMEPPAPNAMNQPSPDAPANQAMEGSLLGAGKAMLGSNRFREERNPDLERAVALAFRRGASLEELNSITVPAGYGPINAAEYMQARKAPKGADITFTVKKQVPVSFGEEISGSPTGGTLMGLGNAGSFGMVQRLAPEAYQDAQNLNPNANLAGEVLGSITGTAGLGKLGTAATSRLGAAGQMLAQGGGRAGNLVRGVGTDAVYSGIYGANTGQGAGESALQGALGSLGGRAVGKTLGSALGGLKRAPGADELLAQNVPLTVGQQRGGMLKSFEDRASSVPVIGDIIGARRLEGVQGFNRAAFNQAGQPIGATVNETGQAGIERLLGNGEDIRGLTSQAYDNATAGVSAPVDDAFRSQMADISGRSMPDDYANAFDDVGRFRVLPAIQSGQLTGEGYQQAIRGLKSAKSAAKNVGKSGFEDVYKDNLSDTQGALRSLMERGGGADVVQGLGRADQAYRSAQILKDAVGRARNGSRSGEVDTFMPSQLNDAIYASGKKFPGKSALQKLATVGQQVLPSSIPDSGSGGRLMQGLTLGGVGALGGGAGYATGGGEGAATGTAGGLALLAALAAGGTKPGQKAIGKLLFGRPAALRSPKAQRAVSKLQGLFGAAAIPLAIE